MDFRIIIALVGAVVLAGAAWWWWYRFKTPNIEGTWIFTRTDDETNCGGGVNTSEVTVTVTQNGTDITLTVDGQTIEGTLDGNQLNASGSYREDGGYTEENMTATVGPSGKTLSGSSTWTWHKGDYECTGTSTFTAVRASK